jgi:hypothetical protein
MPIRVADLQLPISNQSTVANRQLPMHDVRIPSPVDQAEHDIAPDRRAIDKMPTLILVVQLSVTAMARASRES